MKTKKILAIGFAGLLATGAFAGDSAKQQPSCCKKPQASDAAKATNTKMRCSLTGKVVDKCCCEQREGKTYCPLAGKTVEKCCCTPVADDAAKK